MHIEIPEVEGNVFVDGGANNLGTIVRASFLNALMRSSESTQKELTTLINKAGIVLDSTAYDQVYKSIQFLIDSSNNDIQEKLGIYFSYDPNRLYKPFERIIFSNREIYQVYDPKGVQGKDPRDNKNRPAAWAGGNNPYHWIKLDETGERGQIGQIIITQSYNKKENWIPIVGGPFTTQGTVVPWLYLYYFGRLPNLGEKITFGMRNLDFMRFASSGRTLGSQENDTMRQLSGYIHNAGFTVAGGDGVFWRFGGMEVQTWAAMAKNIASSFGFEASRVTPTSHENRPVNTAFTAFVTI